MKNIMSGKIRGFTLIELLVVVLIIGILAAVAVPQYEKAVDKSRFATLIVLVKAVANAKSEYYLSTGEHARTFDVLSIELPAEFTVQDDSNYGQQAVGNRRSILLDASDQRVVGRIVFSDNSYARYYMPISEVSGSITCGGTPNTQADTFCNKMPGAVFTGSDNGYSWYRIPN